jgi:hypothetical protein
MLRGDDFVPTVLRTILFFIGVLVLAGCLGSLLATGDWEVSQQASEEASEVAECLETVTAELELLAGNVLDGNMVVLASDTVTIYTPDNEVLATGEFLANTSQCQHLLAR